MDGKRIQEMVKSAQEEGTAVGISNAAMFLVFRLIVTLVDKEVLSPAGALEVAGGATAMGTQAGLREDVLKILRLVDKAFVDELVATTN